MHPSIARARALFLLSAFFMAGSTVHAQELVVTPCHDYQFSGANVGDPVVVIPNIANTPLQPPQLFVAPPISAEGGFLKPHGLALANAGLALVSHVGSGAADGAIDVIDTAQATRVGTLSIAGYEHDGLGTLAVNPAATHLLVLSGFSNSTLFVVPAPFSAASVASAVGLPADGGTAQTHAIAFDRVTGRAFVGHLGGVSVLDPPYLSIAFTIPLPPSAGQLRGRAVAVSADGDTLASTVYGDDKVQIVRAPFSAASAATQLVIANAHRLDGLAFTPDGGQLLVVDAAAGAEEPSEKREDDPGTASRAEQAGAPVLAFAIDAPFDVTSVVQPLDTGAVDNGFEDIDISADGGMAVLSGGSESGAPLVVLHAPFTTATVRAEPLPIGGLGNGYDTIGGRGTGTARFWSAPLDALPQLTTDTIVSATEGDSGTSPLTVRVRLSRPTSANVTLDYATSDGSLTAPDRYLATSGTLTLPAGASTASVTVPIVGNTVNDGDGNFRLTFSNPRNASLLGIAAQVVCRVVDNDDTFIITTRSPLPDASVGAPYSVALEAQGEPAYIDWGTINSNVPAGLSIDIDTGMISGIPATAGTSFFTVTVSNAAFTVSTQRAFQITVIGDEIFANAFE